MEIKNDRFTGIYINYVNKNKVETNEINKTIK